MRSRRLFLCWLIPALILLCISGWIVFRIDPFFHYHAPLTERYAYRLDSERYQNDGILRHFDYDTVLIGSSVTRNFKTSETDALFGVHSVKIPFGGTTYKAINDTLVRLFSHHPDVHTVIRALDMTVTVFLNPDLGRNNLPDYLYNDFPLDDVHYLLNRDVLFDRSLSMILERCRPEFEPGITSFDQYQSFHTPAGRNGITYDGTIPVSSPGSPVHLTDEERGIIRRNVTENIVSVVLDHPDTEFYLFFAPYNILFWQQLAESGEIYKQFEEQTFAARIMLEANADNLHLFSFTRRYDITTDMNHYCDGIHYAHWVNSLILKWIHDGEYELTTDNYQEILAQDLAFYTSFDYGSLNRQEDYEYDLYAAALVNQELTGAEPIILPSEPLLSDAGYPVTESSGYRYLVFSARKESGTGMPKAWAEGPDGALVADFVGSAEDADNEWHRYVMDLGNGSGALRLFLRSSSASGFIFRDITLY